LPCVEQFIEKSLEPVIPRSEATRNLSFAWLFCGGILSGKAGIFDRWLEMTAVGAFFNKLLTSDRSRKEGAAMGQQPPFRYSIVGRPIKPGPQVRKQPG